jgi:hypothetical protein
MRQRCNVSQQAEANREPATQPMSRSAAAERMRAHRSRRQAGLRRVTIELRETEVTELIRRRLLDAGARHDLYAIRTAIHRHLDDTLSAKSGA